MNPGLATRGWCAHQKGVESWLLYNSVTHNRLDRSEQNTAELVYYSHMLFDIVVSDKTTNKWLSQNQNNVGRYIDNGVLFSDYVWEVKSHKKNDIRKQLEVPKNAKLLTFFDNTIGLRGVMNQADYLETLKCLHKLIMKNKDYFLAIKCKKGAVGYYQDRYPEIAAEFRRLFACARIFDAGNKGVEPYAIMGVTDLAIVAPISSVIYEAVVGGVKTLSFDPFRRYAQPYIITESFPFFSAHSYDELLLCVNYWLEECDEKQFLEFQNQYIKKHVDPFCDHKAVERLRDMLLI